MSYTLEGAEGKYSLGELRLNLTGFHHMLPQLALEEEDVWRAVLNWAKYQAGVTQPTAHWAEEERVRVCQHLTGVINHVRLLLIGVCHCVTFNSFIVRHFSHRVYVVCCENAALSDGDGRNLKSAVFWVMMLCSPVNFNSVEELPRI